VDAESTEIRRTVTLTADDVVAANQLFARRWRSTSAAWAFPVLVGLVVAAIYLQRDLKLVGIIFAAGAGLAAAVSFYLLVWFYQVAVIPASAGRSWRESAGMRKPTDYVLTPDTLSLDQEDSSARRAWPTLTRWSADERCLILYNTPVTFYMLPRRDFSDDEVTRIKAWLMQAGVPRY
jgi:hypothetical protein